MWDRWLFTADWQAEFTNLELCRQAWRNVLALCREHELQGICIAGDLKAAYNPVDVRVTKFWLAAIGLACSKNLRVFILLGNHDRIGMYSDAQNWLPVLARAGAEVFDAPTVGDLGRACSLAFLPFASTVAASKQNAAKLVKVVPDAKVHVLVFHADLSGCRYNQTGARSEGTLEVADLKPECYDYCIGGHIHLAQKLGKNVYYVGSPFPSDWGEANQEKSFLVLKDGKLKAVPTGLPGWYDPTWPGFPKDKHDWQGCRVRLHVPCPVQGDYMALLSQAKEKGLVQYQGADVVVVAEFAEEQVADTGIAVGDSDAVKIRKYVQATLPPELKVEEEKLVKYLGYKLQVSGGRLRQGKQLEFQRATGENFLSFAEMKTEFGRSGLVVVQGDNRDRLGRSNGAGKTSLLQAIPVALFGCTFKGQKFDAWARRNEIGEARIRLQMTDRNGTKVVIERCRRPNALRLLVNGVDQSSGMNRGGAEGTQGLIEQLTGFTWQTLANAVYIDPSVARMFLSGTKAQRTELLAKFQNLERFRAALTFVRADEAKNEQAIAELEAEEQLLAARVKDAEELTVALEKKRTVSITVAKERLHAVRMRWKKAVREYNEQGVGVNRVRARLLAQEAQFSRQFDDAYNLRHRTRGQAELIRVALEKAGKLLRALSCPTCAQPIDKGFVTHYVASEERKLARLDATIAASKQEAEPLTQQLAAVRAELAQQEEKNRERKKSVQALEAEFGLERFRLQQAQEDKQEAELLTSRRNQLRKLQARNRIISLGLQDCRENRAFYSYAVEAFSRDGIPAFLNRQLIPVLNRAADYYAGLFADKTLQVRFELQDGQLEPVVINSTGGASIEDQSSGERALAGLIASFALREIAPKCNVLILDEPGEGLDRESARQFARGLREMKGKFETVYLTTHNPAIVQELAGEQIVTVVKEKGVSRVQ